MSKEYGTALFSLALENGSLGEYEKALESIEGSFNENPQYFDLLASPNIPMSERLDAIEKSFGDSVPEYIISFLQILCQNGKIKGLFDAIIEYKRLYNEVQNVSKAKVCSAIELTDKEKVDLQAKLEKVSGHGVEIEYTTDSSLIGGLIIEFNGKVMDGSLRHRLRDIKDVMDT